VIRVPICSAASNREGHNASLLLIRPSRHDIDQDGCLQPDESGTGSLNIFSAKREIFRPLSEADGNRILRALIEKVLGRADDVKMAEPDTIIAGSAMWVPLTGARNRDFTRRGFEIDMVTDFSIPVWIIDFEVARVNSTVVAGSPAAHLGAAF